MMSVKDHNSDRTFKDYADVVIDGTGILNKWKWPKIEGLHDFQGTLLHSAQWDNSLSLKGKRVALLGAGSSGVQILPNIYDEAEKVVSLPPELYRVCQVMLACVIKLCLGFMTSGLPDTGLEY